MRTEIMMSWMQEVQSSNPIMAAFMLLLVGSGVGSGSMGVYSSSVFATEDYVDQQVAGINRNIADLKVSLEYQSAKNEQRLMAKEMFELDTLRKTKPVEYTTYHSKRISILKLQEADLVRRLNRLSIIMH